MNYTIYAEGLFSKRGFGDGDGLDDYVYDWVDENTPHRDAFLLAVIKKHLIPEIEKLDKSYRLELIGSNHNPVRIFEWDGKEVDHYSGNGCPPECANLSVEIPREEIAAMVKEFQKQNPD